MVLSYNYLHLNVLTKYVQLASLAVIVDKLWPWASEACNI